MIKHNALDNDRLFEMLNRIFAKKKPGAGDDLLYEILSTLGLAVAVDRTYLFDFQCLENGNLIASQRAEWVEVGQNRQISNPHLQNIDLAEHGFSDWAEQLLRGKSIVGLVKDFPAEQFGFLGRMQGIVSIVFMPVFLKGKLVGAMGYDDCSTERYWEKEAIEALRLVAGLVGTFCYSSRVSNHPVVYA
jgi:GAF domain-containing protein